MQDLSDLTDLKQINGSGLDAPNMADPLLSQLFHIRSSVFINLQYLDFIPILWLSALVYCLPMSSFLSFKPHISLQFPSLLTKDH